MRLVRESAPHRYVAEGSVGAQHVLGCKFHPSPDYKRMRGFPECAPEGAREVRFAALNECAEISDRQLPGYVGIDVVLHFSRLPSQQAARPIVSLVCFMRIGLLP
jgi:hypothetical protein